MIGSGELKNLVVIPKNALGISVQNKNQKLLIGKNIPASFTDKQVF